MSQIIAPIRAGAPAKFFANIGALILLVLLVSSCASGALSPGLTARMDQGGANLDRAEAINLINQYRATRGAVPLAIDPSLNASAQELAAGYAASSNRPTKPDGTILQMQLSAGYSTFADTFSGWRGRTSDAAAIADSSATRVGIGVAYSPNSTFGVHWVLLLAGPETISTIEIEPVLN